MTANTLHLSADDAQVINAFHRQLNGAPAKISSKSGAEAPDALIQILNEVLRAVAEGRTVSIAQLPEQITTSTAASSSEYLARQL